MTLYDPFDESVWDDPFPTFKRLRDEAPAYYLPEYDCWFLSRFEDVWQMEQDQRKLTSKFGTTTTHLLTRQTPISANLSSLDGREHTAVRAYLNPFFKPGAAAALEARIRPLAGQAVDAALAEGGGNAVDIGGWLSVRVVCLLLGLPLEDADQVLGWVNGYFDRVPGRRGSTEQGIDSAKELGMYLFRLSKQCRGRGAPEGTVLHKLHTQPFGADGEPVDDMAVAVHLNMLTIGGTETFPKIFSAALYRLWQHPEQRAACAADPARCADAFHETLRYDMPTQMLGRTVAQDFELHGETLREGSGLMFLWGSANRDEREFEQPDRFDIDRRATRILSFGHGQHSCLGAHVARVEGRVLLQTLLERAPRYDVDESGIERLRSEFFRGFAKLPIRL